jgi:hypothetical protein
MIFENQTRKVNICLRIMWLIFHFWRRRAAVIEDFNDALESLHRQFGIPYPTVFPLNIVPTVSCNYRTIDQRITKFQLTTTTTFQKFIFEFCVIVCSYFYLFVCLFLKWVHQISWVRHHVKWIRRHHSLETLHLGLFFTLQPNYVRDNQIDNWQWTMKWNEMKTDWFNCVNILFSDIFVTVYEESVKFSSFRIPLETDFDNGQYWWWGPAF